MNKREQELHLFIIWEKALKWKEPIIEDIKKNFKILQIHNIQWDQDNYAHNLSRFYGENLPNNSEKEIECGSERFSLITVMDNTPLYAGRLTSKGVKVVNTNIFDAKVRYRTWTGGGHKVHATDNVDETKHNLFLLLGVSYEDYMTSAQTTKDAPLMEINVNKNIAGCIQWDSLQQLFSLLNQTTNYVVLRNFDHLPNNYYAEGHGDIDILVDGNPAHIALLMNATPVYSQKYRAHYKVNIKNETVRFDIRYLGDNYYDTNWEGQILENRRMFNGFYIPDLENFKYSLLYHALIHKPTISNDYREKLINLGFSSQHFVKILQDFMDSKGYFYSEPLDLSVYFNTVIAKTSPSLKRRIVSLKNQFIAAVGSYLGPKLKAKVKRSLHIRTYLLPAIKMKLKKLI